MKSLFSIALTVSTAISTAAMSQVNDSVSFIQIDSFPNTRRVQSITLLTKDIKEYTEFYWGGNLFCMGELNNIRLPFNGDYIVDTVYYLESSYDGEIGISIAHLPTTREGLWFFYYENGQLQMKGTYKGGKKNGKWEYYDISGNKIITRHFESGIIKKQVDHVENGYLNPPEAIYFE